MPIDRVGVVPVGMTPEMSCRQGQKCTERLR